MENIPPPKPPFYQLAPGLYRDANGNPVFNAADILVEIGLEDTPEARNIVMDAIQEMVASHDLPETSQMIVRDEDETWRIEQLPTHPTTADCDCGEAHPNQP